MPSPWLPVAILVVVGVAFTALTRRVAQRIERSPNRFGSADTVHDFVGRVYRVGGAVLFVFLIVRAIWPETDTAVGGIPLLVHPAIGWLGLGTMILGSGLIIAAQVGMGSSWRIGLDRERTGLVTTGLFAFSRNPTFLGMMGAVLGAFLFAPTVVSGIVLAAAWIAFSVQIRMEEDLLHRLHGAAYERYRTYVPRWIGLPGRRTEVHAGQGDPVNHGQREPNASFLPELKAEVLRWISRTRHKAAYPWRGGPEANHRTKRGTVLARPGRIKNAGSP